MSTLVATLSFQLTFVWATFFVHNETLKVVCVKLSSGKKLFID